MSAIEWTDQTWNPVRGCSRVSAGCENCYAERQAWRFSGPGQPYEGLVRRVNGRPVWTGEVREIPGALTDPAGWAKPARVFVNSMSDLFHPGIESTYLDRVFALMAGCPWHCFQVLTKRPERALAYLHGAGDRVHAARRAMLSDTWAEGRLALPDRFVHGPTTWPLPHVWLGVSVEDQATADARIPLLLDALAVVRFVSYEPALEAVDLFRWLRPRQREHGGGGWTTDFTRLDWVIVGGESGPGARPCAVEWIRATVQECQAAGVPVFVKQLGARPTIHGEPVCLRSRKGNAPDEWPEDLRVREYPTC